MFAICSHFPSCRDNSSALGGHHCGIIIWVGKHCLLGKCFYLLLYRVLSTYELWMPYAFSSSIEQHCQLTVTEDYGFFDPNKVRKVWWLT